MHNRRFFSGASLIAIFCASILHMQPALAASGSEPIMVLVNNGTVLTLANPGTGPAGMTQDQMLTAQPRDIFTTRKIITYRSRKKISKIRLIQANSPNPSGNTTAQQSYPDQWDKLTQSSSGPKFPSSEPSSCSEPTKGRSSMLDCYYHPWTDTPGSIYPQYQTSYPWKAVGKLFFHDFDEPINHYYHHCTAQVISGPPNNLLITAGHCVIDPETGKPSKDIFFVPAFSNGSQPFGQFKYQIAMVLPEFVKTKGEDRRYDVALISLQNDPLGNPVSYYTGTLGLILNASYHQNLTQIGYSTWQVPDGAWSTVVNSQSYQFINNKSGCDNKIDGFDKLFIGSPMGPGSSGGAWINSFYPFDDSLLNRNYVASVVSGGVLCLKGQYLIDIPEIMIGPRLTDTNIGVLCKILTGGCGTIVNTRTITVKVTGNGYVASTPPGLICAGGTGNTTTCTGNFAENSNINLSAIPERGGTLFVGWSGSCSGTDRSCIVNMNTDQKVSATFN